MHWCLLAAGSEEDLSQVVFKLLCSTSIEIDDPKFTWTKIQVPYQRCKKIEMREYTVHFRPALDVVRHMLEDPCLHESLIYYPERHYIRKPGTNENIWVWSDIHTTDNW